MDKLDANLMENQPSKTCKTLAGRCTTMTCGFNHRKMLSFLWMLLLLVSVVDAKKKTPKCTICKDIVRNFHKGLSSTQKSNYGGGNTKWEEKSLGSYATSEVRLVEIMEQLCEDAAKECHSVLEEYEELVERYWFKEFAQNKDTDFHVYFCIEHMQACCPNNTFGKECFPCAGGVEQPCSGNGNCDGEGTRGGTGLCKCHSGYRGDLCNECKDGYFEDSSDETHKSCKVCHISCKNTCSEAGPQGCDECKDGWQENEELGCQDINECSEDPCDENQYCTNTQGSFTCFSCHDACETCTGAGPGKCRECSSGFTMKEETSTCIDNNECVEDSNLCTGENEFCKNIPGSYECVCKAGFHKKDGLCVKVPKDDDDEEEEEEEENADDGDEKVDNDSGISENTGEDDSKREEL